MKNWRKWGIIVSLVLSMILLMAGCGNKLSEKFDEAEVKQAAQTMVNQVNEGSLDQVYENTFLPVMQQGIPLETLRTNLDSVLGKLGDFESFEKIEIAGTQDKDTETPYAVAIVLAKYADGKAQYTITFDTELKCAGFYIK